MCRDRTLLRNGTCYQELDPQYLAVTRPRSARADRDSRVVRWQRMMPLTAAATGLVQVWRRSPEIDHVPREGCPRPSKRVACRKHLIGRLVDS